jgi:hypothetical protein
VEVILNSVPTSFTVADYCASMKRGEIIVNKEYQRSDQVWPSVARSYLIETILKGFPIPKLYLRQVTDVKSRKTYKEIVDGQQRSTAILNFFDDELKLGKSVENEDLRNQKYSELDQEFKHAFLEYPIQVDLFVSASTSEVIEVFRRMNSYTVPLNAEEQRHASYQGKFKWFINELADKLEPTLLTMGVFKEKQLVRMQDNKLLTELCDSLSHGIRTTDKKKLDAIYKDLDDNFPEKESYYQRLTDAFGTVRKLDSIHETALMKPYLIYSLTQAIMHINKPVKKFKNLFRSKQRSIDYDTAAANLTALAQATETEEDTGKFRRFVLASREKTNVRKQREIRFKWMCRALTNELS